MKVLIVALMVTIFGAAFAAPQNMSLPRISRQTLEELQEATEGCNANICFALDGSGSVVSSEFESQRNFVLDVLAAISGNALEVAATQYGLINRPISFLTADQGTFVNELFSAEFAGDLATSVGSGIVWCHRQLRRREGEALKMVVIGDARNNLGGSPVRRANRFRRRTGGEVCVVEVGEDPNERKLLRIAGRNPDLVFTVDEYLELTDIVAELVLQICGVELL